MKPTHYFLISITLIVIAALFAYTVYPLQYDESVSVLSKAGVKESPGFVTGIAGAGLIQGYIEISGVVIGHGYVEVHGRDVPIILVKTADGTVYNVLMGGNVRDYLRHAATGNISIEIYYHPVYMMNHIVYVKGYRTTINNTVVAVSIQMSCSGMHGNMPMHGWEGEWRENWSGEWKGASSGGCMMGEGHP